MKTEEQNPDDPLARCNFSLEERMRQFVVWYRFYRVCGQETTPQNEILQDVGSYLPIALQLELANEIDKKLIESGRLVSAAS